MNAKSNSIQILAKVNPDTITRLSPRALGADKWENSANQGWSEGIPPIRRTGEGRGEKAMVAASRRAFMAANIGFPSADGGEFCEALAALLLWLCGLLAIGFCLL